MRALHQENVPSSLPLVPSSRLVGHEGPVQTVTFTENGKHCLTGGHDRTVRLWNPFRYDPASSSNNDSSLLPPPAMPIQIYTSGYTHPITSVVSVESRTSAQILVAACQKTLVISDLITQQVKRRLQGHHVGHINAVAAVRHAEAYLSASYDGTVAIWDGRSSDYKPIQVLKEAKDSVTDVHVVQQEQGDYDESGTTNMSTAKIRTASVDGVVRTYDLRKGLLDSDDCGSPITSMAPTKDGECLTVSCLDGTIRLLQCDSGELLNTYSGHHKAGNYGLDVGVLASDSTIISGSEDGTCILYDLVQAHRVQALEVSPGRPVCSIATHPKISSVVITASYDETVTVWSHNSSEFFWE